MNPTFARNLLSSVRVVLSRRRRLARRRLLSALALSLSGCSGGNAFTGGSVPIGKAVLKGRVARSEDATLPLYNAQITLVATPQNSDAKIFHAATDHNGVFTVTDIPTDAVSGPVTVTATSADGAYKAQQISFRLTNNHSASVVFALPPATYTPAIGTTLTLSPAHLTAQPGQRVPFAAQIKDPNGVLLPLAPTLFFDDSFGVLNPDGTFSATSVGTGAIAAYWYNGLKASATVTVSATQQALPPSPP